VIVRNAGGNDDLGQYVRKKIKGQERRRKAIVYLGGPFQ